MQKVELLSPARDLVVGKAAIDNGADAVYIGAPAFGARKAAANSLEDIGTLVRYAHRFYCRVFVTLNTILYDSELAEAEKMIRQLYAIGVDALIIQDPGILNMDLPPICLHASTQMHNYELERIKFLDQLGFQRIVLARELSLEQIREIRKEVKAELEVFIHGALCVSLSGQCYLSQYMFGRSANRGECAQPCRYQYALMEEKRPGEYMPVCEDENGTYIFSAHDLNLMPLLPELVDAGIKSLKIEGRMKTAYYVATVTAAYRRALDLLADGGDFAAALPGLMAELSCASHRDSDTGFALGKPANPGGADGFHQEREYLAHVVEGSRDGRGTRFLLKNRFKAGETIELLTPSGVHAFEATPFLREKTGEIVDTLGIGGEIIRMDVPFATQTGDFLRGETRNHRK